VQGHVSVADYREVEKVLDIGQSREPSVFDANEESAKIV
jgi:hypothetical protein